jgi:hypothetical protein
MTINRIVVYQLSADQNENLCFDFRSRIDNVNEDDSNAAFRRVLGVSLPQNGSVVSSPPGHGHLHKTQRRFSIKVDDGITFYAIKLKSSLGCYFGHNEVPIGIFSHNFYKDMIYDIALRDGANGKITDFSKTQRLPIKDFDWLTFEVNQPAVMHSLAAAEEAQSRAHARIHPDHSDKGKGQSNVASVKPAIPFYFNLYDKDTDQPIWVLNNHRAGPHAPSARWHGKVHPNSNGFLLF